MRIAYLTALFPGVTTTFVSNEVEAHHQAGVDILPLSCDLTPADWPLSDVARQWRGRTVAPSGAWARLWAVLREAIRCPAATARNLAWLLGLLGVDVVEFLKGIKEFSTAAYVAPACRAHRTELIHVRFASRPLTGGIMLGRLLGVPVSCTAHAFELWGRRGRNLRYRLKHCAFIAAISQYNVDYIRHKCGPEIAGLCRVVHCGIDLTQFDGGERTPAAGRILLISQMAERKGHRYLVEACGILRQRGIPHECILIGTGPEQARLQEQIRQLGLASTVTLVGAVANDRLRPYLDSAAVFALPAIVASDGDQDGIPVALMEAMACGLPVISTNVSGIPELLRDGQAGVLVPQRDAKALADALEQVLTDRASAERLGAAGRQAVGEDFDIRRTSEQLRRLFAEVIERSKGQPYR